MDTIYKDGVFLILTSTEAICESDHFSGTLHVHLSGYMRLAVIPAVMQSTQCTSMYFITFSLIPMIISDTSIRTAPSPNLETSADTLVGRF